MMKLAKKYWPLFTTLIILVAGLVALWQYQGFRFTDYHRAVVAELSNLSDAQFEVAASLPNVARVDRDLSIVEYQQTSIVEIQSELGQELAGEVLPFVNLSERIVVMPYGLSLALGYLILFLGISFVLMAYLFIYRRFNYGKLNLLKLLAMYTGAILLGLATYLGLLSIVSGIYQLTEFSLAGLWVVMVFVLTWLFNAFMSAAVKYGEQIHTLQQFIDETSAGLIQFARRTWMYLIIVMVSLGFALGTNIIFDLLLITLGLLMAFVWMTYLPGAMLSISQINLRKSAGEAKIEPEVITTVEAAKSKLKYKSKKKKRRKR